jgi:hypothetical protein
MNSWGMPHTDRGMSLLACMKPDDEKVNHKIGTLTSHRQEVGLNSKGRSISTLGSTKLTAGRRNLIGKKKYRPFCLHAQCRIAVYSNQLKAALFQAALRSPL